MRRFNPDRELSKIRNGNKKKVIISICALLVVGVLGYSFAIYQVRHTNKIVYTTIDKFVNKDIILSVKLDDKDESVNEFPTADSGYVYSHTECEKGNITDITWNEGQRSLNMNSKGPDKCTVYFVKSPFHMKSCEDKPMSECLLEEGQKFPQYLAFDDPDSNARCYGKQLDNYIWFNCDDYSNPTEETCERWRIIGSFNNIEKVNEDESTTKQNLIKIIRADGIGWLVYDGDEEIKGDGSNDWTIADLQESLNGTYYNGTNLRSGKGITNLSRAMIEKAKWNIGGYNTADSTALQFYEAERGTATYSSQPSTWDGYIGLMYPSDYAYATIGSGLPDDLTTNRTGCLTSSFVGWRTDDLYKINCAQNSWLLTSDRNYEWTLTPYKNGPSHMFSLYEGGLMLRTANYTRDVRPTLYLTHDTKITGGNGTYENPYTIDTIK